MTRSQCTGVAAQWCPVHGSCTCPERYPDATGALSGERDMNDPGCPLHAPTSTHATT